MNGSMDSRNEALAAIHREMARQMTDARATMMGVKARAAEVAELIRHSGRLVLLGMGGSHAVGRIVEPWYRARGIDTVALPLSEQLDRPLDLARRTVLMTSQSGESAEVLRWFHDGHAAGEIFGMTMEAGSSLATLAPSLIGSGGTELAFAATRSLTVTLALHAAVLQALGEDIAPVLRIIDAAETPGIARAVAHFAAVRAIITSGRAMQGVAEAIALGLAELSRIPCFSLEGGQLRHGPVEMLGPDTGVVMFRSDDATCERVTSLAALVAESGSPLIVFDASGHAPVVGAHTITCARAGGLAAAFSLLPVAQRFMVEFAAARVPDVGTPRRCSKVTRVE